MIYSDLRIPPNIKVEILPTDRIVEEKNLFVKGDRFIGIFRGVHGNLVADNFKNYIKKELDIVNEFEEKNDPEKTILNVITRLNFSTISPPSDFVPDDRSLILIFYIKNNSIFMAEMGGIRVKQKIDGRYVTISHQIDESEMDLNYPKRYIYHFYLDHLLS